MHNPAIYIPNCGHLHRFLHADSTFAAPFPPLRYGYGQARQASGKTTTGMNDAIISGASERTSMEHRRRRRPLYCPISRVISPARFVVVRGGGRSRSSGGKVNKRRGARGGGGYDALRYQQTWALCKGAFVTIKTHFPVTVCCTIVPWVWVELSFALSLQFTPLVSPEHLSLNRDGQH